jgi:hypothetical protein
MTPTAKINAGFLVFLLLLASAFLAPRVISGNETGLAAGATAAMTFFAAIAAAAVIGIVLLVLTLRHRATLPTTAKVAGFLPLPLVAAALAVVVLLALQKQRERDAAEPPPRTMTPTATPAP